MCHRSLCLTLVNVLVETFLELKFRVRAHLLKQVCARIRHSEL